MKWTKYIPFRLLLILTIILLPSRPSAQIQIDPQKITIARDQWGVPHIRAATDAEVAYGLAWATCEDQFFSLQENLLATRGRLAEVKGKEGAIMDFAARFTGARELVAERYEKDLSPDFRKVLEGYVAGVNAYAERHPEEVWLKGVFPVTGQDLVQGYVLALTLLSSVHEDIARVVEGNLAPALENRPQGSNGFAFNRSRTEDGHVYLASNTHQPLEGPYAWYEAHLASEEGWNVLGATFPGGCSIFVGANEYLGWTHTVNHPDLSDVYRLHLHPEDRQRYLFDNEWKEMEVEKVKLKVKMGFLRVPITMKIYHTVYGPALKGKDGYYYAFRFPARMDIRAAEQWYRMNKARDLASFRSALEMTAIPCTNLIYADRDDHILYAGLGAFPRRNPAYDWKSILPGHTAETLWAPDFYPLDSLPVLVNPPAGYVINTNNTPFNATAPGQNLSPKDYNPTLGYMTGDNNRSLRLQELIQQHEKIDYETFKKIKYDRSWRRPAETYNMQNLELLFQLDETKYPKLAGCLQLLKNWDREATVDSEGAAVYTLFLGYLFERYLETGIFFDANTLDEPLIVEMLEKARRHLQRHFGTINVPLGELQKHVRGDKVLPIGGAQDVLAAVYPERYRKGRLKIIAGESYIALIRFTPEGGVLFETINAYGASEKPESPHYADQMDLYVRRELKTMTLDWEEVLRTAERVYAPE